ncbi:chromosomal replication initiator protein DnaA [Patescibacteria group bacterium]
MGLEIYDNPKEFWKAVLGQVELKISPMVFKSVITRTTIGNLSKTQVEIICEDEFVKKNLETKHLKTIGEIIQKVAGKKLKVITKVGQRKNPSSNNHELGPLFSSGKKTEVLLEEKRQKSSISPYFTFSNFITGKSNNLAYAIATAVSDKPGELYNPVFIYSGVGLGKTHLLHAIGNRILESKPGMRVIYTTGEAFMNELIEAIQSGGGRGKYSTNKFRNKYRKADVFLIDDVQFIIGRQSTQEEFFHTFNALYMAQKQIVITSDRPPKEFSNIEERITSRFGSGIIADIQIPDVEMRTAILRTKRDFSGDKISNDVLNTIAEKVYTNTRELEGAYLQVVTYAKANGLKLTKEVASKVLSKNMKEAPTKNINVNDILKAVCTYYAVKAQDVKGKRRTKEIVIPRQVAMYLIKEVTDMPFMSIGDLLGGRDHTTVMYGVEKIEEEIAHTGKVAQDVVNVKQLIFAD